MRILITGHNGFVGSQLQQTIKSIPFSWPDGGRVDLCNASEVQSFIAEARPDALVHLAAQSNVPEAFSNPQNTFEVNFIGTFNLLLALKQINFRGRLLYVSSGEVYGLIAPEMLPVKENYLTRPRNPYAVSKIAAEALCYQWSQTENFEVVIVRPFNHVGPGQGTNFAISNFARQIVEIKRGKQLPTIEVGDISVTRDFTDVRDVARAYQLLLLKGKNGEIYNVCSGKERSIQCMLEKLLECANIQPAIKKSASRVRAIEQRRSYGCCEKLFHQTGWEPLIPLEETLKDILTDWEEKMNK